MELLEFWTICSSNGIILEKSHLDALERYHKELLYWNEKINLISRRDEENLWEHHILHSLAPFKYIDFKPKAKCIDIGTGGGLPGIPICIARPDMKMVLCDSIAKKIKMTQMFAQHSGCRFMEAVCARAEELYEKPSMAGSFDYVFSRAVAKISDLVNWSQRLVKKNASIVLFKGGDIESEIETALERYPNLQITEVLIKFVGYDWFEKQAKKLVICTFSK